MRLLERVGLGERRQKGLTRVMEVVLVGLFFIGIERGSVGIVVNTGIALLVTELPEIIERDFDIPMDPALSMWITGAVFLHALGTVGVPGGSASFYRSVPWWDHLTHVLSSSVVASVGYATVRAIDRHSETIYLPPKFTFVFILLFTLAFGVLWEVVEFAVGGLGEIAGGKVLTQYGIGDTMLDLVFDAVGGVVVAAWGSIYLSGVVDALAERLDERAGG